MANQFTYKGRQKINILILNPSVKMISFMEQEKKEFKIVTVELLNMHQHSYGSKDPVTMHLMILLP